jgi:hypothetical protein
MPLVVGSITGAIWVLIAPSQLREYDSVVLLLGIIFATAFYSLSQKLDLIISQLEKLDERLSPSEELTK